MTRIHLHRALAVALACVTGCAAQPQIVGESVGATISSAPGIWPHLTAIADSAPDLSNGKSARCVLSSHLLASEKKCMLRVWVCGWMVMCDKMKTR